jgi:hypothetical protein
MRLAVIFAPPQAGELWRAKRETEGEVIYAPLRFASLTTSPASGGRNQFEGDQSR